MAVAPSPRFRRAYGTVRAPSPETVVGSDLFVRSLETYAASRARSVQRVRLVSHNEGSYTGMAGTITLDTGRPGLSPEDQALVIQGRLRHELLHVTDTDREVYGRWQRQLPEIARTQGEVTANRLQNIFNILEDGRIESLEARRSPGSYAYIQAMNQLDPRIEAESTVERDITLPKPEGYTPTDAAGRELEVSADDRVVIPAGTRVSVWGKTPYGPGPQMQAALLAETNPDFSPGELLPEVRGALEEMKPVLAQAVQGSTADALAASFAVNDVLERRGILPQVDARQGQTQPETPQGLPKPMKPLEMPADALAADPEGHDVSAEERSREREPKIDPEILDKVMQGPLAGALGKLFEKLPQPKLPGPGLPGEGDKLTPAGPAGAPSDAPDGQEGPAAEASGARPGAAAGAERPELSSLDDAEPEDETPEPSAPAPSAEQPAETAGPEPSGPSADAATGPAAEPDEPGPGQGEGQGGQEAQGPPEASALGGSSAADGESAPNRGPTGFEAPPAEGEPEPGAERAQSQDADASSGSRPGQSAGQSPGQGAPAGERQEPEHLEPTNGLDEAPKREAGGDPSAAERSRIEESAAVDGQENAAPEAGGGQSADGGGRGVGQGGSPLPVEVEPIDLDELRRQMRDSLTDISSRELAAQAPDVTVQGGWVMPEGNAYHDAQELAGLYGRAVDDAQLGPVMARAQAQGARIARQLEAVMRDAPQADYYLRQGRTDASALPRVVAGSQNVFYRERPPHDPSVELEVVVDCSGSTEGYRAEMYEMALAFAFASRYTNIPITIAGFSGGESMFDGAGETQHYEFFNGKRSKNDVRAVKAIVGGVGMGGTPLAEAIEFGAARLAESRQKARLMAVITDGAASGVQEAVAQARALQVDVTAFGLGCSPEAMDQMFGPGHWREITDYSQPAAQMTQILQELIARQVLGHPLAQAPRPQPRREPDYGYDGGY